MGVAILKGIGREYLDRRPESRGHGEGQHPTIPRSDVGALPAIRGGARTATVQPASSTQHDRGRRNRKGRPLRVYGALEGRFSAAGYGLRRV